MSTCATCKHWKTARVYIVTPEYAKKQTHPDGSCYWKVGQSEPKPIEQMDDRHQWGECYKEGRDDNSLFQATCDAEGIGGELKTASEFGCNQHAPGCEADHVLYRTHGVYF